MENVARVSCPLDCFDLCRFLVKIENNRIIDLKGDPDHPLTRGRICKKGKQLASRFTRPDRLVFPMLKTDTGFKRISYDLVFDLVCDKLELIEKTQGPSAVLNYTGGGYGGMKNRIQSIFFNCFGGDTRPGGSLCWGAGMAAQEYDFGSVLGHNPNDILNAKLVILWGRNPKFTNSHLYSMVVRARKKGTKVVVIDPVRTATAKAFDHHIPVAPSTDGAMALAMANVLIRENLVDMDFVRRHVKGFERFAAYVKSFTPESVSKITQVPAHMIENLALEYGQTRPSAIYIGYGMQRYENGGNNVRCIDALAALAGHVGKKGGGVNYAARSLAPFLGAPESASKSRVHSRRVFPAPRLGAFLEKVENPFIAAAFFASANPLVQTPDVTRVKNGIDRIGFSVVFDHFMTDTAASADLVLPAASVFEQDDIFVTSMYSHVLNYSKKALEPPGTIMPEFEFYLKLARKMGIDLGFDNSKDYLSLCAAPLLEQLGGDGNGSELSLEDLAFLYPRLKAHDIAWEDKAFLTPSGKIEIYSEKALADGLSALPEYREPMAAPVGLPLRLLTCHALESMHSQGFGDREEVPMVHINEDTARMFGLVQGELVKVKGEVGNIYAMVKLDPSINNNTAFIYQGCWIKSGAVNFLTCDRISEMGGQAAYYDSFCTLIKE